jgi:calnexin
MMAPFTPPVQDKKPHLYTAIITPDNKVRILVDGEEKKSADLLSETDFREPINPPKEVDDPTDVKPEDWVDSPKMVDPAALKPEDWDDNAPVRISDPTAVKPAAWEDDEPQMIPDPKATAPADWDADEDGEWEAPMVPNPKCKAAGCGDWRPPVIPNPSYKGTWKAPEIDNPDYKGEWKARQVPNPKYYFDDAPHNGRNTSHSWFPPLLLARGEALAQGLQRPSFASMLPIPAYDGRRSVYF